MVRNAIDPTAYTTASVEGPYAVMSPAAGCSPRLEGFTSADFDCLCALLVRLRQHIEAACKQVEEHHTPETATSPGSPLISVGPSGIGGQYQREY